MPQLLNASEARLARATTPEALQAVMNFRSAMRYVLTARLAERPILRDWRTLLDFLQADCGHITSERFRVLHLNVRFRLIRDEVMCEGTIDQAAVYVREVIRRAIDHGSASIILVHNHPGGDPSPSRSDIDLTRAIASAGRLFDIAVQDHLIISSGGHASLRSLGLI